MNVPCVVIDASLAIKAILPNPLQTHCLAVIERFSQTHLVAPALWSYETTSALAKGVHFGDLTESEVKQALEQLSALPVRQIAPDITQNQAALEWTRRLKRASVYDSYYLALAEALECDLWTADQRLFNALKDTGLDWLHTVHEINPSDGLTNSIA